MSPMRACQRCGNRTFRPVEDILSAELRASGVTASLPVPGHECTRCRSVRVPDDAVLRQFELAVARELADLAVQTGEAIRYMRRALRLRAADLARLLDLTPETISHWETGKAHINRAAFVALGALVQDAAEGRTTTRDRLAALADGPPRPRAVSPRLS